MSAATRLTTEQCQAIRTTDRSVIVSAAAGSGKTRVLAERCAHLVCDAPPGERCDVDQLLVLTFTDAAAAEMRSRIVEAIRARGEANPDDARLDEQLLRAEAAQISTIHSFCLWIIRRWFDQAGVDPMVSILDAEEASVLKRQVLEDLFERRYSQESSSETLLGEDDLGEVTIAGTTVLRTQRPFSELIEVYGLGQDGSIAELVLRLYEFTTSLPKAGEWLDRAVEGLAQNPDWALDGLRTELNSELELQLEHCGKQQRFLGELGSFCRDIAARFETYCETLKRWIQTLEKANGPAQGLDAFRDSIAGFAFEKLQPARKLTPEQKEIRAGAKKSADELKNLFERRLRERFGHFTASEWLAVMAATAPFVSTLTHLVREFAADYAAQKRRMNVLDFSDLERVAFELVCRHAGGEVSPVCQSLRDRFHHVLVDEFQDINPIQQAIIEGVSREQESGRTSNLFVVGDVKQSIYRFRLAEPEIFLGRLEFLRRDSNPRGVALFLQSNFRSTPTIIGAVNTVFRMLMQRSRGGLVYDSQAELRSPELPEIATPGPPVEVHLLESRMSRADSATNEDDGEEGEDGAEKQDPLQSDMMARGVREGTDPALWDPIEREAYLIGLRIAELTSTAPGTEGSTRIQFGDIAILLRSTRRNADRVSAVLTSMGIPTHAEVGGSLMGALEVRDVMAALHVLDNARQDIPLAAVLRSGIFGMQFSEDELVEVRASDRKMPFHAAVQQYALTGPDGKLREKLEAFLRRVEGFRDDVTRRPLAQVVWNLIHARGYMAYVSGLPNGPQRRANLLKIHDLARGFGSYRKQGLHRFLRVMEQMLENEHLIPLASSGGAASNVVRIMSVHHSKGMEFPVVFVAGLGTKFNLGDRNGRMIFERKSRIGLRGVDRVNMVEYPTPVHLLAACEVERCAREEELRILYVAMTRAEQRLILVGSTESAGRYAVVSPSAEQVLSGLTITTAKNALDWLLPVLINAPAGIVRGLGDSEPTRPLFEMRFHDSDEMSRWKLGASDDQRQKSTMRSVANLEPLPEHEPLCDGDAEVAQALGRVHQLYPDLAATSLRATMAASDFPGTNGRRVRGLERVEPIDRRFPPDLAASGELSAVKRGTATHRFLQLLDFKAALQPDGTRLELDRLLADGLITKEQAECVAMDGINWFVTTPLADQIRRAGDLYHRELRFITTEPLSILDPAVRTNPDDRVLIRGIVDGVLVHNETCEVIDYKTDVIREGEVQGRADSYRPQLEIYAHAVERLWRRPVSGCRLVFLAARQIIAVPGCTHEASV